MESHWAAEHLQIIRTLMERSAVYRRALAPVMIMTGLYGCLAAILGTMQRPQEPRAFALFWMAVAAIAMVSAFLLVRRQALKEQEPFWSPPTRRVTEAMLPAFLVGLVAGLLAIVRPVAFMQGLPVLPLVWVISYGCALHAAGFFMQRGIKLFGWVFILGGSALLFGAHGGQWWRDGTPSHLVMGVFFGALHLAYGVYLYFTERSRQGT